MIGGGANLTNSTQAPGTGLELDSQFACIYRAPTHRRLSESIYESTDGQPNIGIIVYSGLGIAGPDIMKLDDFHGIVIEESAIYELEFFPGTPAMSALGTPKLLNEGKIYTLFCEETRKHLFEEVSLRYVIPQWVNRVSGADTEAVELFNGNVDPVPWIRIGPDCMASLINNQRCRKIFPQNERAGMYNLSILPDLRKLLSLLHTQLPLVLEYFVIN